MLQSTNTFSVALRNLTKDARNVEGRLQRKSIIHQYSNFDSQVYAPMTRIGVYLDSNSEQYNVKSKLTTSLNGQPHKDNVMCILMLSIISSIMYYPPPPSPMCLIIVLSGLLELEETLPHQVLHPRYSDPL